MPEVLRSTSLRVVAPCWTKISRGITMTVCGVSRSGSVNFGEETDATSRFSSMVNVGNSTLLSVISAPAWRLPVRASAMVAAGMAAREAGKPASADLGISEEEAEAGRVRIKEGGQRGRTKKRELRT